MPHRPMIRAVAVTFALFVLSAHADRAAQPPAVSTFQIDIGQEGATDVAPTEDGLRAFVIFEGVRKPRPLAIVDLATRSLVAGAGGTIDLPFIATGGAVVGRKLFIAGQNEAVTMDIDTHRLTTLFKSQATPWYYSNVAVSASRRFVYMVAGGHLLAINTKSDNVVAAATIGEGYYHVAVSPDEERVYVNGSHSKMLARYDAGDLKLRGESDPATPSGPGGAGGCEVMVGPDGPVYLAYRTLVPESKYSKGPCYNVAVLDPLGVAKTSRTYDFYAQGTDITPDGAYLITGSGDLIATRTLDIVARAPIHNGHVHRIHVVPDGRRAFVTTAGTKFITVFEFGAESLPATGDAPPAQRRESVQSADPGRTREVVSDPPPSGSR